MDSAFPSAGDPRRVVDCPNDWVKVGFQCLSEDARLGNKVMEKNLTCF